MRRTPSISAVLTGDVVNSTQLSLLQEKSLFKLLSALFTEKYKFEFFRGDSFQLYMDDPKDALRLALACRTAAIGLTGNGIAENGERYDVRISVGIGQVSMPVKSLSIAKGEAFLLSGRNFDSLGNSRHLAITCDNEIADIGLAVIADYLDIICQEMTVKQAELIMALLQGSTQQQVAITLDKSKSTISQLASAGRWPEIEKLLQYYQNMIEKLYR
jgi:hypothetical protein